MIFADRIPELKAHPHGFPGHYLKAAFMPEDQFPTYAGRALVGTYVRCVEAAYRNYRQGRQHALKFIYGDGQHIPISDYMCGVTSFEDCVGYMHLAVRCMEKLRQSIGQDTAALFRTKPAFLKGAVPHRIREIRNATQHNYEMVLNGQLPEGTPYMLGMDGGEVPVPESDQPGQTIKTWDRLIIGDRHIYFTEIVEWLEEMGDCAERRATA